MTCNELLCIQNKHALSLAGQTYHRSSPQHVKWATEKSPWMSEFQVTFFSPVFSSTLVFPRPGRDPIPNFLLNKNILISLKVYSYKINFKHFIYFPLASVATLLFPITRWSPSLSTGSSLRTCLFTYHRTQCQSHRKHSLNILWTFIRNNSEPLWLIIYSQAIPVQTFNPD